MSNFGMIRVAAAVPETKVGNVDFNVKAITSLMDLAQSRQTEIVVFPELCLTAYSCGDLFRQTALLNETERGLTAITEYSLKLSLTVIVGAPVRSGNHLFNAAVVIQQGRILGVVPKSYLPNHNEFYEQRWFSSGFDAEATEVVLNNETVPFGNLLFTNAETGATFGIEICEDLWAPVPPSSHHCQKGAQLIFNLSASNELIGKQAYRKQLIAQQSARANCAYIYASAGVGESTTDTVYGGGSFIVENGQLLAEGERFALNSGCIVSDIDTELLTHERQNNSAFSGKADYPPTFANYQTIKFNRAAQPYPKPLRTYSPLPFVPKESEMTERCEEIFAIQTSGLAKRVLHTGSKQIIIGISGGLDSTLALLVGVKALDKLGLPRQNIVGITMPGFGTTGRTYNNAMALMQSLGVTIREISITDAVTQHFSDIGHDPNQTDTTYENSQARERTQILMDIANQINGLVIGTGDLSELALGWATYNGDHMSMYGVNAGVPKTLVRYLVKWAADSVVDGASQNTLIDILDTPVSPELLPATGDGQIAQKTEDIVGPYELHDFFLYYMVRFGFSPAKIFFLARSTFKGAYPDSAILKWLRTFVSRFFSQQFKRSCLPDGPKVGSVSLSPRGDWRMPSDASPKAWLKELEGLES